jgi:hypothetical protein
MVHRKVNFFAYSYAKLQGVLGSWSFSTAITGRAACTLSRQVWLPIAVLRLYSFLGYNSTTKVVFYLLKSVFL